ncbi:hypothetical protein GCM10009813_20780 [Brevibacterium marinum]
MPMTATAETSPAASKAARDGNVMTPITTPEARYTSDFKGQGELTKCSGRRARACQAVVGDMNPIVGVAKRIIGSAGTTKKSPSRTRDRARFSRWTEHYDEKTSHRHS